jgi:hypothetical protein
MYYCDEEQSSSVGFIRTCRWTTEIDTVPIIEGFTLHFVNLRHPLPSQAPIAHGIQHSYISASTTGSPESRTVPQLIDHLQAIGYGTPSSGAWLCGRLPSSPDYRDSGTNGCPSSGCSRLNLAPGTCIVQPVLEVRPRLHCPADSSSHATQHLIFPQHRSQRAAVST